MFYSLAPYEVSPIDIVKLYVQAYEDTHSEGKNDAVTRLATAEEK